MLKLAKFPFKINKKSWTFQEVDEICAKNEQKIVDISLRSQYFQMTKFPFEINKKIEDICRN